MMVVLALDEPLRDRPVGQLNHLFENAFDAETVAQMV